MVSIKGMRTARKAALAGLAVTTTTLSLAACSNEPIGSGGAGDSDSSSVGFAGSFLTDPFQVVLVHGVEAQAKTLDLQMLPATNADADPAKQMTDISTLISQNVGGLIAIPVDGDAIVPAVEQANKRGVPVVTVDEAPNGGEVYMIVRADNYVMGQEVCEEMGKSLSGAGTVLELQGDLSSVNGKDRHDGFVDCMKDKFPKIKIIGRPTNWVAAQATDAAQAVVGSTDVDGIYMASDSVMGPGVQKVLTTLGKWTKTDASDHIVTISIDGTAAALKRIRDGYQDALVSQPVDLYAKYAVQYIADALDGKTYEPGPTDHNSTIEKGAGGNLTDLLPSPVVTHNNVDDNTLWGNEA